MSRSGPGTEIRKAAWDILRDYHKSGRPLKDLVPAYSGAIDSRDLSLLNQIIYGTVRWQSLLDYNLSLYWGKKSPGSAMRILLRLMALQIFFLDKVPNRAAVHTSVALAREFRSEREAGFCNALGRKLSSGPIKHAPGETLSAQAINTSHPEWLVQKWYDQAGPQKFRKILQASNEQTRHWVRIKKSQVENPEVGRSLESLKARRLPNSTFPYCQLEASLPEILVSDLFVRGILTIQDPASWYINRLVDLSPSERFLDLCSAPGGKTAALIDMYDIHSPVFCADISPKRLSRIRDLKERQGFSNVNALVMDVDHPPMECKFDKILIDAPCSNCGVISRRPEVKWRISPRELVSLNKLQSRLLEGAVRLLNPGGTLIYATCSPLFEETFDVVQNFLSCHREFQMQDASHWVTSTITRSGCILLYPGDTEFDGFFGARLHHVGT